MYGEYFWWKWRRNRNPNFDGIWCHKTLANKTSWYSEPDISFWLFFTGKQRKIHYWWQCYKKMLFFSYQKCQNQDGQIIAHWLPGGVESATAWELMAEKWSKMLFLYFDHWNSATRRWNRKKGAVSTVFPPSRSHI